MIELKISKKITGLRFQACIGFFDRIIKIGSLMAMSIFVGRNFGQEGLGQYSYLMGLLAIATSIICGGTDIIFTRELSDKRASVEFLGRVFLLRFLLFLLCILACFLLSLFSTVNVFTFASVLVAFVFVNIFNFSEAYLILRQRADLLFFSTLVVFLPLLIVKFWLMYEFKNFNIKFYLDAVECFFLVIFFCYCVYFFEKKNNLDFEKVSVNFIELIKNSTPLWFNAILVVSYTKVDQLLLVNFLGEKDLGAYSSVIQIANIITVPVAALMTSAMPKLIMLHGSNTGEYHSLLKKLTLSVTGLCIVWTSLLFFLGGDLVVLLFGNEFKDLKIYLVLYSISVYFSCLGMIAGQWVVVEKKYWMSPHRSLVGFFVSLVLNAVLIPSYGLVGCCIAAIITSMLTNFLLYGFLKSGREIFCIQISALKNFKRLN